MPLHSILPGAQIMSYGYPPMGPGWGRGRGRGMGGGWGMGRGGPPWAQGPGLGQAEMPSLEPPAPGALRVAAGVEADYGLESPVSPRLGRAPFIAVVDVANGRPVWWKITANAYASMPHGVGVALAQWLIANGVKAVLAVNVGPNALMLLQQAGVSLYTVQPGVRLIDALRMVGLVNA